MKRRFALLLFAALSLYVKAADEDYVSKFLQSYKKEQSGDIPGAISVMTTVYTDCYEKYIRLGELHYRNNDYVSALRSFQFALEFKPRSVEAYLLVVQAGARIKDWKLVGDSYDKILDIDPDNKTALYYRGLLHYNTKQYQLSKQKLDHLVELYPLDYDGVILLAWCNYHIGFITRAKKLFNLALCINSDSKSAREGLKMCEKK